MFGVEELQVVDLFTDADVFDGDPHLLANCDGDSSFGGAVEFSEDDSGAVGRFTEVFGLVQQL